MRANRCYRGRLDTRRQSSMAEPQHIGPSFAMRVGSHLILNGQFLTKEWSSYQQQLPYHPTRCCQWTMFCSKRSLWVSQCQTWASKLDAYQARQLLPGRSDQKGGLCGFFSSLLMVIVGWRRSTLKVRVCCIAHVFIALRHACTSASPVFGLNFELDLLSTCVSVESIDCLLPLEFSFAFCTIQSYIWFVIVYTRLHVLPNLQLLLVLSLDWTTVFLLFLCSVCAGYVIQFYSCRKNGFSDGCTCERSNVCSSTQPNLWNSHSCINDSTSSTNFWKTSLWIAFVLFTNPETHDECIIP